MLVIFNLIGLVIAFAGAVLGFIAQLIIHPAPLTESHSSESSDILFLGWGLIGIIADAVVRVRLASRTSLRIGWWVVHPNAGGQMFFVPCWIWGILWVVMGVAGMIRS